jgi:Ca2+-binding RTX toxin-like protein
LTAGDIDTAVFTDVSANYQIAFATDANGEFIRGTDGNIALVVTHLPPVTGGGGGGGVGVVDDGIDTLYNIERLQFSDVTFDTGFFTGALVSDQAAQGVPIINDNGTPLAAATSPLVGDVLSVGTITDPTDPNFARSTISDFEGVLVNGVLDAETAGFERLNIPLDELDFQWQYAEPANGDWVNIVGATNATFTPTDFLATGLNVGVPLRVQATFIDGLGVKETVVSAPTALLLTNPAVNHAPIVVQQVSPPGLSDTSARDGQPLGTAAHPGLFLPLITNFSDDITAANQLVYTATLKDGSLLDTVGLHFDVLTDAAGLVTSGLITGTPTTGPGTIDVLVKATDAGGLSVTDDFIINVLPTGNRAPVITSDGGGTTASVSVPENTTVATTVTATDPNITDTLTFSIAGGLDAGKFTINATTGALAFATPPNFEVPTDEGNNNVYDVIVQVSDGTLIDTQAIAVTVTNVNEAPVITSNGGGDAAAVSVAENSTAVTTVTATDPDAGAALTFSLAGADASKFTINPTTGALSFITAPDFEAPTDAGSNNVYDVVVQASDGSLTDTQALAVSVTNVAGLTLTGTAAANTLTGGDEEDIITGLAGADLLSGLGGNDTIIGGTGNDVINAGAGNDLILYSIGDGADTVIGDVGLDTLNISGTAAADTLTVAFDGTVLTGFAGGTLSGVESITADLLAGSDTLSYGTTTAAVTVDLATNSASGFTSIVGIENVTGGAGADTLIGDGLANALNGGNGNDTLSGGLGVDTLTGGAGTDTVSYLGETDALVISLATGTTQRGSAAAPVEDVLVTIENVIGGSGSDSITGSTGNNELDGGAGLGNDTIDGGSGNDNLMGGEGNDQLFGGIGTDSIDGGAGNDTIVGGAGNDTLLGGDGNDSFSYAFGDGVDTFSGGTGADSLNISGTTGNDALSVVFNGTSITSFTGGTITSIESITADLAGGTDTLSYAGTTVDVSVDLAGHTASGFPSLLGIENVTGGTGNDTFTGDAAANILAGGAGNDTYFVGAGDTVTEAAGAGTDTVNSTATFTLGANVENLNLTALAAIDGTGNALANVIADTGGGNNVLSGLGGNDTITGGAGDDTMTGGTGNDMFVFHTGFGNDVITDFDANPTGGQDLLDLSAYAPDINALNFAAHVGIAVSAGNTVITIDSTQHITLTGVTGVGANIITSQDFIL